MVAGTRIGLLLDVNTVLGTVALVLALVIVAKAVRGYRQNGDRAMLLLAGGLVVLVFAPAVLSLADALLAADRPTVSVAFIVAEQLFEVVGLGAILGSMYVRR